MSSTWIPIPDGSDFPETNLPYGVFSTASIAPRVGVAIGDDVLDVGAVLDDPVLRASTLDPLLASGPESWRVTRERVQELVHSDRARSDVEPHLHGRDHVDLHLPFTVADYVD